MQRSYFVVEGPHDVELIWRMLKPLGLRRVQRFEELEAFWHPLVPREFPPKGDLLKRVPVPTFFWSEEYSIAVDIAGADNRLVPLVSTTWVHPVFEAKALDAIGVFLDADDKLPAQRFAQIKAAIEAEVPELSFAQSPNQVREGRPRTGIYVLPDGQTAGTLEDLLLDCAQAVYPTLWGLAKQYVDSVEQVSGELTREDLKGFKKPSGRKKALFASMVAVLKPGKASQMSIQESRWFQDTAFDLPRVQACRAFVRSLIGAPAVDG